MNLNQNDLKDIVLNVKTPHIIRNLNIPWPCFKIPFQEWCAQFDGSLTSDQRTDDGGVVFDTGSRKHSNHPQWEMFRGKRKMTVMNFYENSKSGDGFFENNWAAFSYKNIKELPIGCVDGFNFNCFGFPDVKDDITFWLSSTDAHTPCHYDSYGCNIVVQVYGRKSWMLFPPNSKLTTTRIPYEESSVYCTETFFSPRDFDSYKGIEENCYQYTLNPGDVLVVPPKWWHYVENECPSLSVNAWIPIKQDMETQVEECIVRILMKNFIQSEFNTSVLSILNPNEAGLLDDQYNLFEILQYLVEQKSNTMANSKHEYNYMSDNQFTSLLLKFKDHISPVPKLSKEGFQEILRQRSRRFDKTMRNELTASSNIKHLLINSVCSPSVINRIAKDLMQKIHNPSNSSFDDANR